MILTCDPHVNLSSYFFVPAIGCTHDHLKPYQLVEIAYPDFNRFDSVTISRAVGIGIILSFIATGCGDNLREVEKVAEKISQVADKETFMHTNELIHEKSPYLLQHAHNPVNWMPWGKKAFEKAETERKIILLSIGYSTCHWCHVMERESFENEEIAEILNRDFISIKVDREERPDVDNVYMNLAQAIGAGGGWPLNLFLTPDRVPFTGGTYFPPEDRHGRRGFKSVLQTLAETWKQNPENIQKFSNKVKKNIESWEVAEPGIVKIESWLIKAAADKVAQFDGKDGGFSQAPKFPMGHNLSFLLRQTADSLLEKVAFTLKKMAQGGIYDQLGGGFHRYSTDVKWLAPHFEKMLYDQALLIHAYLDAYLLTGDDFFLQVVRETVEYLRRDMRHVNGGFYSAEDADSEGEEGTFYVWTMQEVREVLEDRLAAFASDWYGITPSGNFEGKNILTTSQSMEDLAKNHGISTQETRRKITEIRQDLLRRRSERIRPHLDDKILADWNGLILSALSRASQILPENTKSPVSPTLCLQMAKETADFVLDSMRNSSGALMKSFRQGLSAHEGFIEDYAFFINGLLDLYEASAELKYFSAGRELVDLMLDKFWDEKMGGFHFVARDQEQLIQNPKEIYDGAIPSGNSLALLACIRLARMTGDPKYEDLADKTVSAFASQVERYPSAFPQFLMSAQWLQDGSCEIVLAGEKDSPEIKKFLQEVHSRPIPRKVLIFHIEKEGEALYREFPFVKNQGMIGGKPAFYLCENRTCKRPVTTVEDVRSLLDNYVHTAPLAGTKR